MATTKVSEALARPARTAMQATPALVLTDVIDAFLYDLSERQFGVLVAFLTLVIGFIQVAGENHFGKALFRSVPSVDAPVVDSNG